MLTYTKNITIKNSYNIELTDYNEFDEFNFDLDCASYKIYYYVILVLMLRI